MSKYAGKTKAKSTDKAASRVVQAGPEWIKWTHRGEVDSAAYEPGKAQFFGNKLNLWQPSTCKPTDGDVTPFLRVIEFIASDPVLRKWFIQWLAFPLNRVTVRTMLESSSLCHASPNFGDDTPRTFG